MLTNIKNEIYRLMDNFLTESTDQEGKLRSVEQLNKDRHLFVENMEKLLKDYKIHILDQIENELMNGSLRDDFDEIFKKDQEAVDGIRPSKSNRSGALVYSGHIIRFLRELRD
jgi:hypothetical protein